MRVSEHYESGLLESEREPTRTCEQIDDRWAIKYHWPGSLRDWRDRRRSKRMRNMHRSQAPAEDRRPDRALPR